MEDNTFYMIMIGIVVLIMLSTAIYVRTKYKRPTDYRALFVIGIAWITIGVADDNHTFTIMGIVFMIVGLINRKKWKENRFRWSKLSSTEKKIKMLVLVIIATATLAGIIVYYV